MSTFPKLFLTCFGLGYMRPASGTWGSTPPVVLVLLLIVLLSNWEWTVWTHVILNASLILFGLIFSIACVRFGSQAESLLGRKDPSQVVADETAGQCVALLFLPWSAMNDADSWKWNLILAATAFFIFRAMDIIKPPPANQLQRLSGGWGILVDDLFAGVYALLITQAVVFIVYPSVLA